MSGIEELCGWVHDPREVERIVATLPHPVFGLAAHDLLATEERDVFAWEQGEQLIFGRTLPAHAQTVGDCVSHGGTRAAQDVIYFQLAKMGVTAQSHPELCLELATEPNYALSRVEIGGGRIRGDGSNGAWGAKAMTDYGVLQRKAYGSIDLTEYSGSRARSWGAPGRGCPDELEPIAMQRPIKTASLVDTAEEAAAALRNMYFMSVCSGQGFTTQRDSYGFCNPRGRWAHCMEVCGIATCKRGGNNVLAVCIQQSWGNSPTGPDEVQLASGRTVKLRQGCFMVEMDVFESRMLRAKDTFAFSHAQGFAPQRPNFNV